MDRMGSLLWRAFAIYMEFGPWLTLFFRTCTVFQPCAIPGGMMLQVWSLRDSAATLFCTKVWYFVYRIPLIPLQTVWKLTAPHEHAITEVAQHMQVLDVNDDAEFLEQPVSEATQLTMC